jgi:hypothetical protein
MTSRKEALMRSRSWLLILGRGEEEALERKIHLHSRGGRRTLERSSVFLFMSMVTMLHSVHNGTEGEGRSKYQQQRLMRLQTGFRGSSY